MSSTPLLSASGGLPGPNVMQDHPVFLRASHSPWRFIPQNVLVVLRGVVLAYLVGAGAMIGHYKLTEESEEGLGPQFFDFSNISYVMVLLYHVVTFSWTFTHLHYPDTDSLEGGVESLVIKAMSLPRNMASQRKQFYFTLFNVVASVFSYMDLAIYWFVTRQHEGGGEAAAAAAATGHGVVATGLSDTPLSDLFGEGWLKPFVLLNLHGVSSLFMAIETLFMNSIKRPVALGSHHFGLMFLSGVYLGWAAIGNAVTGKYAFFWMDKEEVGSQEAVTLYSVAFVLLSQFMYTGMHGLVAMREGMTRTPTDGEDADEAQEPLDS